MKIKSKIRCFGLFILTLIAPGCASLVTKTVAPVQVTNSVPILVTNAGVVTTQGYLEVVKSVDHVSYRPSDQVTSTLATAQAVNAAVPSPVSPMIAGVLALLSAGLGTYAKIKSNLANRANDNLATATDMLTAVVSGVEAAGATVAVKPTIANNAKLLNVDRELDIFVQDTVTPKPES